MLVFLFIKTIKIGLDPRQLNYNLHLHADQQMQISTTPHAKRSIKEAISSLIKSLRLLIISVPLGSSKRDLPGVEQLITISDPQGS
jgi:hypothetical protein